MTLIGLDLTASRVRAVGGPPSLEPAPLALESKSSEMSLAVSLEEHTPIAGSAGAALARCKPHLACLDFLQHLGTPREWMTPRHRLDALRALSLVYERLAKVFCKAQGVVATLPAYLSEGQIALVARQAYKAKWPWLGSVTAPVAAAEAARDLLPWSGVVLVVDVDGYALTWSAVAIGDNLHLLQCEPCPNLSLNVWLNRLIDGVANHCIRRTRRDPRESGEAEQGLYDQLPAAMDAEAQGQMVELTVQTPQWYQQLMLHPGQLAAFCAAQVRQSIAEMKTFAAALSSYGPVVSVLATAAAARLPGLLPALNTQLHDLPPTPTNDEEIDFGDSLMLHDSWAAGNVHVLPDDALARAAHQLATAFHRGELAPGHIESLTSRSSVAAPDGGPARLQFRGQEHVLTEAVFVLGRDKSCDLVLESELYPTVSARHCEIVFDRRVYVLRDRSRHGTLVNDQRVNDQLVLHSGDWIRLGPGGPLVHFLGQASDQRRLMPTA